MARNCSLCAKQQSSTRKKKIFEKYEEGAFIFFTDLENFQKFDLLCTFLITFPLFTNCLYLTISFPVCISSCLMATIATKAPRPQSRKRSIRKFTNKLKQMYWWNSRGIGTKSGSLRFSQFSGCWLILSVYIIMSFDFPFIRLFGVR